MKVAILAIGQKQPAWADAAVDDYLGRFPADFKVELTELKAEARSGRPDDAERCRAAEAQRLRAAQPAEQIARWRDAGESVAFAIGGPDGLAEDFKRGARLLLRLSSLTLPHALARVLLAEQLYRAWSILARHPYHRA